ncbi:ATP-dependent DNA helicase DinG [Chromobacterium sp.]|uniref:ATP-dependent DNA helicase DinG n=1 Tax=Chromobacterium sp. TaxID=306190 RepID=UPI0035B259B5
MLTDAEKDAIRDHYRTIADNLPGFRPRAAQRRMLAEIANALSRSKDKEGDDWPERCGESIAVIEGPTGVGKSLAYLLAGGLMAKSRAKKLVVTSATIALQEQLVNRDLPFVVENSGLPLTFALAKGRGRYLCPQRIFALTAETAQGQLLDLDPTLALWDRKPEAGEIETLRQLADAFYYRKWNGDRDTWDSVIDDGLWSRVTNDRHGCLKAACPNRPECPFYLARDVLENVDVVVANHDLMLADVSMGGGVILPAPEESYYCIDEAHHLAKKAVNQFSAEHSLVQAMSWLDKVAATAIRVEALTDKVEIVSQAIEAASACSETLTEWLWLLEGEDALAASSDNLEPTWLIEDGVLPERFQGPTANMATSARSLFKQLSLLSDALGEARKDKGGEAAQVDKTASDLGFLTARAEQLLAVWELFEKETEPASPPIAKWITRRAEGKGDYLFSASPVSAAASLAATLWRRAAGAILTSATLRSLGEFELLLSQTGLKWMPEVSCVALDSPFNFDEQGELYLPPMLASPKDAGGHTREIVEWLPKLIDVKEAVGTLVLFSSRKQMQDVAAGLPSTLRERLLIQGEIPKSLLIEQHHQRLKQGEPSVIFGLDSFSEGLDLPGESCVHVIIAKLPFAMPDDPVGKTLSRWIEKRGGNPFIELTVPEASIKLVQAVGRLIRTERDYGRVTILDNRLQKQSYGKRLLASLPPFKRI